MVVEMEKWSALATLDITGASCFGYGFRARGGASISGGGDAGENYCLELADPYNTRVQSSIWESIGSNGKYGTEWQWGRIARNLAFFLLAKLTIKAEV